MTLRRLACWVLGVPLTLALGASCGDDSADGSGGSGAGATTKTATGTASDGGAGGSTGNLTGSTTTGNAGGGTFGECGNKIYECGDQVDNDGDGFIDSADVDCLGPCDNTEDSYYPDLPGMTGAECKTDCFWDNGNGSGTDDCYWDHHCDMLEVAPNFPPEQDCEYDPAQAQLGNGLDCEAAYQMQSETCLNVCAPLTPNGCDCFGCCELPAGSGAFVWLGSYDDNGNGSCTIGDIADPLKCKPCTPVPGCGNPCDPCEVCIGKPEPDPGCGEGGAGAGGGPPGSQCPDGIQECGLPGQSPCPGGYYCITGCCQFEPQ